MAAVYRETEGNPFFMHEVVRLLVKEGRLERGAPATQWSLTIPQGIRAVIGRRLNQLSGDSNRALTVAAVIGREFDSAVLACVTDLGEDRLLEVIEEALAARLIEEMRGGVGRYRFTHALVQQTLCEELTTTQRVRLHRRIAEALEQHYGSRVDRHLAELAHHAVEGVHAGGDVDKAIAFATRAGKRAFAVFAFEDAILHFERALQALDLKDEPNPITRCDLLITLGRVRVPAGDRRRACESFLAAVKIARANSDALRLARAAAGLEDASRVPGRPNEASVALLEEALAASR